MKYKTKLLPPVKHCKSCVFCVNVVINYRGPQDIFDYRCKYPSLEFEYRNKDPLKGLEGRYFPKWCPLEDGDEIEI